MFEGQFRSSRERFLINNRATTLKVVTDILAVPRVSALAPEAGKMRDPGNEVGIIVVLNFFYRKVEVVLHDALFFAFISWESGVWPFQIEVQRNYALRSPAVTLLLCPVYFFCLGETSIRFLMENPS